MAKEKNKNLVEILKKTGGEDQQGRIIKNPKELADIIRGLFKNVGLKPENFKGIQFIPSPPETGGEQKEPADATWQDDPDYNDPYTAKGLANWPIRAEWQLDDLTILVLVKDLFLLNPKGPEGWDSVPTPSISVSQAKNLLSLLVLYENQKKIKRKQEGNADIVFSIEDYAKIRGYTEAEITRGGNFITELKRDLVSGAITSYIVERKASYLIGNFYNLEMPKENTRGRWRLYFNEPYKSYLLNVRQYYPIALKAIADRKTSQRKGYIFYFLMEVLRLKNNPKTDFRNALLVSTLLKRIQIGKPARGKSKLAFDVLAECIYYIFSEYQGVLSEIRLFNRQHKPILIQDLSIFDTIGYKDFKKRYLEPLGISDIRDALISFNPLNEPIGGKPALKLLRSDYQAGEFTDQL